MGKVVFGVAVLSLSACGVQTGKSVDLGVEQIELAGGESVVFALDSGCANELFLTPTSADSVHLTQRLGETLEDGIEWTEASEIELAGSDTLPVAHPTRVELGGSESTLDAGKGGLVVEVSNDDTEAASVVVSEPQCAPISERRGQPSEPSAHDGDGLEAYSCDPWRFEDGYYYSSCGTCGSYGKIIYYRYRYCRWCDGNYECTDWNYSYSHCEYDCWISA